jgi:predicted RNA-binding Zn-ribbon protein involved in translation (DUF1610 family)
MSEENIFCSKCGSEIYFNDNFCSKCGSRKSELTQTMSFDKMEDIKQIQYVEVVKSKSIKCVKCAKKIRTTREKVKPTFCPECYEEQIKKSHKNVQFASVLSLFPGLGYISINEYRKGLGAFGFVFGCLFLPIIGWIFAMIVYLGQWGDTVRIATAINEIKNNESSEELERT